MKLLLIRHGDPDYEHDTLTEKGRREAALLCERLAGLEIGDIYVSPLGRARDTLQPYLDRTGKTAEVRPWLREFPIHEMDEYERRVHVIWDYLPRYRDRYPEWNDAERWMDAHPFDGYGTRALVEEMWQGLDGILAAHGYERDGHFYRVTRPGTETVAFFCHFGAATMLLSHLINVSAMQLLHTTFMAPTAVTTLITEEREQGVAQWRATGIGDTSHLYAAGEPMSLSGFFKEVF